MANLTSMHPNLFWFAPSELSQDAFLCWLLSWADDKYAESNPCMNRIGVSLLSSIYRIFGAVPPGSFSVVIKKQEASIDILCVVNNDTVILIEDKVGSTQHSNQLPRYKDYVSKTWPAIENMILIYLQTGDQSDFSEVTKHGYAVYKRSDLLNILESSDGDEAIKTSDIVENFRCHLREIEDDVNSYAITPPVKWSWNAWKGFYSMLQIELNDGNWNYVANPSTVFLVSGGIGKVMMNVISICK
jgi:hypothetical protein